MASSGPVPSLDEPRRQEEEDDEEDEEEEQGGEEGGPEDDDDENYNPGQKIGLKMQLELDKDDESLRRWKERLLGNATIPGEAHKSEAEVEFQTLRILVDGRQDIELPIRKTGAKVDEALAHFVLKEKAKYRLQFEFTVKNELAVGLLYSNRVWRLGRQVDKARVMLGVYAPQEEPYKFVTEEDTTPHGMMARGHYTAKTLFSDDDGKVYLEYNYKFDIRKEWDSPE